MPRADAIRRDPSAFAAVDHDLVIVGAGIYGVMLALEASRRGLSSLLLERDDFGAHTSYHHLGILHGGFRYVQSLDVRRIRESSGERNWFLRQLPGLTEPLSCLMPLHGEGLRRPFVMRVALGLDRLLTAGRNQDLPSSSRLQSGRVIPAGETRRRFAHARPGLTGGAVWHDGLIADSPRLLIELLRWACAHGAVAVNHCPAERLLVNRGAVAGVQACDHTDGREYEFRARCVINAGGPWCRTVATALDQDHPALFRHGVLVWNLLFDRPACAADAVAVSPPRGGAHTYFLLARGGRLLAGTGHAPQPVGEHQPPAPARIAAMIEDLNQAVSGLDLTTRDLRRIYWGVMPGDPRGRLAARPVHLDHGAHGGPSGLHSISGVKFTTARLVADRTLTRLFPGREPQAYGVGFSPAPDHGTRGRGLSPTATAAWRTLAREESALSLGDLVLRRSDLGDRVEVTEAELDCLARLFSAEEADRDREVRAVIAAFESGLPAGSAGSIRRG